MLPLPTIHKLCIRNRDALKTSTLCGCFYCRDIFPASTVTTFCQERDQSSPTTALCPHCGVDSILPDSAITLTPALLNAMHDAYFRSISQPKDTP